MKVAKWGNSLAIRIPADVAYVLDLHEGDDVKVNAAGHGQLQVQKEETREEILARIRSMRRPLPKDWKFSRAELYEE